MRELARKSATPQNSEGIPESQRKEGIPKILPTERGPRRHRASKIVPENDQSLLSPRRYGVGSTISNCSAH